mgnify:CR=1 FL=1
MGAPALHPLSSMEDVGQAPPSDLLDWIEEGFPAALLNEVCQAAGLSHEEMAEFLGVSPRTLERRRAKGTLTPSESDRLYRLIRLFKQAEETLGTVEDAQAWLKSPQMRLSGRVPLDIARYAAGAREVEDLLGRIRHGIPA